MALQPAPDQATPPPKKTRTPVIIAVVVVGTVLLFEWYKARHSSSSAAPTVNSTLPTIPTSSANAIDPQTGVPYSQEGYTPGSAAYSAGYPGQGLVSPFSYANVENLTPALSQSLGLSAQPPTGGAAGASGATMTAPTSSVSAPTSSVSAPTVNIPSTPPGLVSGTGITITTQPSGSPGRIITSYAGIPSTSRPSYETLIGAGGANSQLHPIQSTATSAPAMSFAPPATNIGTPSIVGAQSIPGAGLVALPTSSGTQYVTPSQLQAYVNHTGGTVNTGGTTYQAA